MTRKRSFFGTLWYSMAGRRWRTDGSSSSCSSAPSSRMPPVGPQREPAPPSMSRRPQASVPCALLTTWPPGSLTPWPPGWLAASPRRVRRLDLGTSDWASSSPLRLLRSADGVGHRVRPEDTASTPRRLVEFAPCSPRRLARLRPPGGPSRPDRRAAHLARRAYTAPAAVSIVGGLRSESSIRHHR